MSNYAETRVANPDDYFEMPQHVMFASKLTLEEKRKVLNSLKLDAVLVSKAASENMTGGRVPSLKPIVDALTELDRREQR